jgi:two-component system OmpR family response regulator
MARILLVDDDAGIRQLIAAYLERHGHEVDTAADGAAMDALMAGTPHDLLILDRMMPGEDGLAITRRLAGASGMPIIILSAMGEDQDRIEGLDGGADDYLAKPVNPDELLARVRAVLRRRRDVPGDAARVLRFAGWQLDLVRRELTAPSGVLVSLTDGEFALLHALAATPGQVHARETLVADLHGGQRETFDRAVDVQVSRLRRKLEHSGGREAADLVRTVRNEGYVLALPEVTR